MNVRIGDIPLTNSGQTKSQNPLCEQQSKPLIYFYSSGKYILYQNLFLNGDTKKLIIAKKYMLQNN